MEFTDDFAINLHWQGISQKKNVKGEYWTEARFKIVIDIAYDVISW